MAKRSSDNRSKKETKRRRDNALLRALKTPPKPHDQMKDGRKDKPTKKEKPAK